MANLNYYAHEIDERLKQAMVNRSSLGMQQVNVLRIPDGQLEIINGAEQFTVCKAEGLPDDGKVWVFMSKIGEIDYVVRTDIHLADMSVSFADTVKVYPGKYKASIDYDLTDTDIERVAMVLRYGMDQKIYVNKGESVEFTVTEESHFTIELHVFPNSRYTGVSSFFVYPFIHLAELGSPEFEPYKPDLQTQINDKASTSDMTAGFDRITDTLGTESSINLFPIDKGTVEDPVIVEGVGGNFYVNQGNNSIPPVIAFEGKNDTSEQSEYKVFFNHGYRWDDNPFLFGDLASGDYVLSFDVLEDLGFSDVADLAFEIYESATSQSFSYDDLIATCTGSDTDFTVTAAKPYITILAVASLRSGESWVGDSIAVTPFLRRKAFVAAEYDHYKPSVIKRISEGDTKLQTEINEFKAANDNYLTPTYEGTLPLAVDGGAGGYADDWTIYGNNNYNPDASPDLEPYKTGVGVRTKNLVDLSNITDSTSNGVTYTVDSANGTITANRTETSTNTSSKSFTMTLPAGTYVFSCGENPQRDVTYDSYLRTGGSSPVTIARDNPDDPPGSEFTLATKTSLVFYIRIQRSYNAQNLVFRPMLRKADTTPDFEPYGYKIPIVSNNKTTDIFIGSAPLTSGKKVTRSSTGVEIPLKAGVNVVDTSLYNKPRVDVKVDRLKNIEQALAGGGYNETQTENITDNVREVTE